MTAVFNVGGALLFAFPDSLGRIAGLPGDVPRSYSALLALHPPLRRVVRLARATAGVRSAARRARRHRKGRSLRGRFRVLDSRRRSDPGEVEIALWFHDAIYDTRRDDNEERSADFAAAALEKARVSPRAIANLRSLIFATKHHATARTADEALLLDVDLSILGAAAERFDEYERQIRREYAWVPEEAYREARARILRELANRDPLYRTEHFRSALDARARENLERSLRSIGADG